MEERGEFFDVGLLERDRQAERRALRRPARDRPTFAPHRHSVLLRERLHRDARAVCGEDAHPDAALQLAPVCAAVRARCAARVLLRLAAATRRDGSRQGREDKFHRLSRVSRRKVRWRLRLRFLAREVGHLRVSQVARIALDCDFDRKSTTNRSIARFAIRESNAGKIVEKQILTRSS